MAIDVDVTLRRLIWELDLWATDHKMINDFFGYGEFLQVSSESERDYPAMVVNATTSSSETWYINYTLEIMLLQNVPDEQPNRKRAMSDMRQILNDLEETITYSDRWQAFSKLAGGLNCTPAVEKGADKGFGWIATFTIKIKKRHGICDLQALMPEYDFETGIIVGPVCDPATETLNGSAISSIPSGGSKAIIIQNDAVPPVQGGTVLTDTASSLIVEFPEASTPLNTSSIYKTGASTSFQSQDDGDKEFGRGVSFTVLDHNNGFGNTNRFTDDLGTQIYASEVIVDWATWDNANDTVLAYFKTPEAIANLTTHINNQPFTKNSLSNWWVCNIKELFNVNNYEVTRDYLNYAPFNYVYLTTADRIWCTTRDSTTVGIFSGNTGILVGSHTSLYRALLCRTYTLAELGL